MGISTDFKAPKPSLPVIGLLEALFPLYLRFVDHLRFDFSKDTKGHLDFVRDKSVVIVLNHADRQDPLVVIELVRRLRQTIYSGVAREAFDWNHGLRGWFFQKFGCFSVNRGITDFQAIRTMKTVLTSDCGKLLVFPEAEVTGDDRHVHEISRPLIHILLNIQSQVERAGRSKSLWVLPVGVSYRLESDLDCSIRKCAVSIEKRLGIEKGERLSAKARVCRITERLLSKLSKEYGFSPAEGVSIDEHVRRLARHISSTVSASLKGSMNLGAHSSEGEPDNSESEELSDEESLYRLRNLVIEHKLRNNERHRRKWLADLDKAERLLIFDRIIKQDYSPIQILRMLDCLELEVCGRMSAKGKQRAFISFGEPIDVRPFFERYVRSRNTAIDELEHAVHSGLQSALDDSNNNTCKQRCAEYQSTQWMSKP